MPFECVGEGKESRAAMATLASRPDWKEDVLVKRFLTNPVTHEADSAQSPVSSMMRAAAGSTGCPPWVTSITPSSARRRAAARARCFMFMGLYYDVKMVKPVAAQSAQPPVRRVGTPCPRATCV